MPAEIENNGLLQQVLAAIESLRSEMNTELRGIHTELNECAKKSDLREYARADLVETQRQGLDTRLTRVENKFDQVREAQHQRELSEKDRDFDRRISDDQRSQDIGHTFGFRKDDRMWAIIALLLSPVVYTIISFVVNHH